MVLVLCGGGVSVVEIYLEGSFLQSVITGHLSSSTLSKLTQKLSVLFVVAADLSRKGQ